MKDGYSFHSSEEDLVREFNLMEATYKKIYAKLENFLKSLTTITLFIENAQPNSVLPKRKCIQNKTPLRFRSNASTF
jgi:hypothetical protein